MQAALHVKTCMLRSTAEAISTDTCYLRVMNLPVQEEYTISCICFLTASSAIIRITERQKPSKGIFTDDDKEIEVGPGDVMLTGTGHGHALENKSDEELVYAALIYSDKE